MLTAREVCSVMLIQTAVSGSLLAPRQFPINPEQMSKPRQGQNKGLQHPNQEGPWRHWDPQSHRYSL